MNDTAKIIFNINEELKRDYKKAIDADRSVQTMTQDLCAYIDRKVKRSKILED